MARAVWATAVTLTVMRLLALPSRQAVMLLVAWWQLRALARQGFNLSIRPTTPRRSLLCSNEATRVVDGQSTTLLRL